VPIYAAGGTLINAMMMLTNPDGGSLFQMIQIITSMRVNTPARTMLHSAIGFLNGMFL